MRAIAIHVKSELIVSIHHAAIHKENIITTKTNILLMSQPASEDSEYLADLNSLAKEATIGMQRASRALRASMLFRPFLSKSKINGIASVPKVNSSIKSMLLSFSDQNENVDT